MTIPSNPDHELLVLCALAYDPELSYLIHGLVEDDFCSEPHRNIFVAVQVLMGREQKITRQTLIDALGSHKRDEAIRIVMSMAHRHLSPSYTSELIEDLKRLARFRSAQNLLRSRVDLFNKITPATQQEFEKLSDQIRALVFDQRKEEFKSTSDYADKGYDNPVRTILQEAQNRQNQKACGQAVFTGHPTHYLDIDQFFDGFAPGHLTIIGARPGVGKTTFALNLALNQAFKNDLKVGFFSLEMQGLEITEKIHSIKADINSRKLRRGEISGQEFQAYVVAFNELKKNPILLDDTSNISLPKLRHKIKAWVELDKVQIVFVDYLQLITASDGSKSKYEQITEISQQLKVLAKETNVPIISLAQVNRESTKSLKSDRPKASELRDSGALEQDADEIIMLHMDPNLPSTLEVMMVKNRFGATGNVKLNFNKQTGLIHNMARQDEKIPPQYQQWNQYDDQGSP